LFETGSNRGELSSEFIRLGGVGLAVWAIQEFLDLADVMLDEDELVDGEDEHDDDVDEDDESGDE
jgi:hypothetical protein